MDQKGYVEAKNLVQTRTLDSNSALGAKTQAEADYREAQELKILSERTNMYDAE